MRMRILSSFTVLTSPKSWSDYLSPAAEYAQVRVIPAERLGFWSTLRGLQVEWRTSSSIAPQSNESHDKPAFPLPFGVMKLYRLMSARI